MRYEIIDFLLGNAKHGEIKVLIKTETLKMDNGNLYLRLKLRDSSGTMYSSVWPSNYFYNSLLSNYKSYGSYTAILQVSLINEDIPHLKELKIHQVRLVKQEKTCMKTEIQKFKQYLVTIQDLELKNVLYSIFTDRSFVHNYFKLELNGINNLVFMNQLLDLINKQRMESLNKDLLKVSSILEPIGLLHEKQNEFLHHSIYSLEFIEPILSNIDSDKKDLIKSVIMSSYINHSIKKSGLSSMYIMLKKKIEQQQKQKNLSIQ